MSDSVIDDNPRRSDFDVLVVLFCAFLLLSNVGATKLLALGPLVFDGGALLFPFSYVLGDVITEVYGLRYAKRAIWLGFAVSLSAALV
ncbi:MAG: VUT family protein, partial [Propionibacteriaceae bacterium]|nr:VUT family protein [Propionibacteriaceae bacterium]